MPVLNKGQGKAKACTKLSDNFPGGRLGGWYPFYIPSLALCIQCIVISIGINHEKRTFPRLYKVITFICSALWAISRTQMTDFPTLLNTS